MDEILPSTDIPAVEFARRKKHKPDCEVPAWSIMAEDGKLPPWKMVQDAAKKTCVDCSLCDLGSMMICADCPAIELLELLMEQVDEEN